MNAVCTISSLFRTNSWLFYIKKPFSLVPQTTLYAGQLVDYGWFVNYRVIATINDKNKIPDAFKL